jgi:hypothetical protein
VLLTKVIKEESENEEISGDFKLVTRLFCGYNVTGILDKGALSYHKMAY